MTGKDQSSGDELRALLEKFAATAGDPPEHGLARVAVMRRRRMRHRRGAVAATMALAVLGLGGGLWVSGMGDEDHDVVAADMPEDDTEPPTLPDRLVVLCGPEGIEVPVASIRPQADGLHIVFNNADTRTIRVWVTSAQSGWDSGEVTVSPGETEIRQPVPPGVLDVGCRVGGVDQQRQITLVDEEGLYTEPMLACGSTSEAEDLAAVEGPEYSWVATVRTALAAYMQDGDTVVPVKAYPEQHFSDPTTDPVAQVIRDDEPVAFAHLEPGPADGEWAGVSRVEACPSFLVAQGDEATPPEGGSGGATSSSSPGG